MVPICSFALSLLSTTTAAIIMEDGSWSKLHGGIQPGKKKSRVKNEKK
jgi:hypothetical protein